MLGWFILGVTFLGGFFLLGRWFMTATPRDILTAAKVVGLVALIGMVIVLALSGRLAWAAAMVPAAVVWGLRFYSVARMAQRGYTAAKNWSRMGQGGTSGRVSTVETAFLHMTLNHDSGEMAGRVVRGDYEGRDLVGLSPDELLALLALCRSQDGESAQVLEAYLDRMQPGWRKADNDGSASGGEQAFSTGEMGREEAARILGIPINSDEKVIKSAHRRLMAALHPDHGGSDYLAAKINQAKEVLLRDR